MPKLKSQIQFIEEATTKHNNIYDYSKVKYVNNSTKIEVICPKHGSFWITPASHLCNGRGCSKCRGGTKRTQEEFLELAKTQYPHYDYSRVEYINSFKKVLIICPEHGEFLISPCKLLDKKSHGCQKCADKIRINKRTGSIEEFIENAKKVHEERYDYSSVNYKLSSINVDIECKEHGIFKMTPNNHISKKQGCPKCSMYGVSKQEKEVCDWVRSIYPGEIVENTRQVIGPKELDIYLPEAKFAIEYNGLYWHGDDKIDKAAHWKKTEACKEKGVRLFHIFSDEWLKKQDIVKSMIKYRLGLVEHKIAARKCEAKQIDKALGKEFFLKSHISGDVRAQVYFGLFHDGELVSCLSLKKPIQKRYAGYIEIARFANRLDTLVNGGFSKLSKVAEKYARTSGYTGILTYADLRFGLGEVYVQNGFKWTGKTKDDYWYTDGSEREFRFKYRAQKPLTEKQVAEAAGVWRVYGCGSYIYEKAL